MSAADQNTTSNTDTQEDNMHENTETVTFTDEGIEVTITGDGTINTSRGTAEIIGDDERITVTLPDRFGTPGAMIDLTHEDAVRFAKSVLFVASASKGGGRQ